METYWLVLVGIIGACCASFAAVVAERSGSERSIITGRSECNHCRKTLRWWELTPQLGYVFVRGKCARCHTRIPWQYPTFELVGALAFVVMWIASVELPMYLRVGELIFTTLLLILFYSDWRDEVFDAPILYSAGVVALILAIGRVMSTDSASSVIADPLFRWLSEPQSMLGIVVMGGIVGAGFLGLFALPTKGTWMAWGDVILAGVLGIWVGYPGIVVTLILAFYLGAIIGGIMLWLTKGKTKRIAFGPFLIVGAFVAQVWSPDILMAIMKLWSIT